MIRKAWSLFWLIVVSIIAFTVLAAIIEPYLWIIALVAIVVVGSFLFFKIARIVREGRWRP